MRAVNQSGLNLRALLDDVRSQTGGVQQAATEIAAGNSDLSVRTDEAANNLQQTASAMEQMAGAVRQTAENADGAHRLAAAASASAIEGGRRMADLAQTMERIGADQAASASPPAPSTASPSEPTSWP